MDRWVLGQLAFWYSFYKVKPAKVVDALVDFWVDLATPGGGTGESNWYVGGWRMLSRATNVSLDRYQYSSFFCGLISFLSGGCEGLEVSKDRPARLPKSSKSVRTYEIGIGTALKSIMSLLYDMWWVP